LRLVTPNGGGHDYAKILESWTLPMVIRANITLDYLQEAERRAIAKAKEGQNGLRGNATRI
jgi:hypothetical protein